MLLFLLTLISVDVTFTVTHEEPLKSYRYHRRGNRNHQYKRRNDYNYNDWDEKKEDYYQLLLSKTNVSKKTTSSFPSSFSYTSTLTLPPTTKSSEVTSPAAEITSPLTTTQLSTTETTVSIQPTSVTSIVVDTTLTSTTEVTTTVSTVSETNDVIDVTTDKMFENFTIEPTMSQPAVNHIVYEINRIKKERREGDFTSSLIMLLKIATNKDSGELIALLNGVNSEVTRLNTHHELTIFGPLVMDRITAAAMAAVYANVEEIRAQLQFVHNCLHNRRGSLRREVNSIIDVTDNIYNEDDVKNVADAIRDLQLYPNINKKPEEIAKELIEAFILKPFKRIQGTTKERLLLMEVDYAVDKLIKSGGTMRRNFGVTATRSLKTTKSIMDYIIESNYVTNKTVMRKVKERMMNYKYKRIKDKKKKISRGITTPIETTTKKVKMHKSKYYIRKYVKKDLYKMTTTTIKTTRTRDKFKYYGKIRKKKVEQRRYIKSQSYVDGGEDDYYYSDDHDDDYTVDDYSDDDVSSETKYEQLLSDTIPYSIEGKTVPKTDVTDYDEESKLKLNLRDAMIHSELKGGNYRRALKKQLNIMREVLSDELTLKKHIYNVFGYKDEC